jgi:hypothetical protein
MQKIHEQVHQNLKATYEKYKAHTDKKCCQMDFNIGELEWVYLSKDHYLKDDYNKLTHRKFRPYPILEKFDENVYRVKLSKDMHISNVFNIRHLHKYYGENISLRSNFHQSGSLTQISKKSQSEYDLSSDQKFDQIDLIKFLFSR